MIERERKKKERREKIAYRYVCDHEHWWIALSAEWKKNRDKKENTMPWYIVTVDGDTGRSRCIYRRSSIRERKVWRKRRSYTHIYIAGLPIWPGLAPGRPRPEYPLPRAWQWANGNAQLLFFFLLHGGRWGRSGGWRRSIIMHTRKLY